MNTFYNKQLVEKKQTLKVCVPAVDLYIIDFLKYPELVGVLKNKPYMSIEEKDGLDTFIKDMIAGKLQKAPKNQCFIVYESLGNLVVYSFEEIRKRFVLSGTNEAFSINNIQNNKNTAKKLKITDDRKIILDWISVETIPNKYICDIELFNIDKYRDKRLTFDFFVNKSRKLSGLGDLKLTLKNQDNIIIGDKLIRGLEAYHKYDLRSLQGIVTADFRYYGFNSVEELNNFKITPFDKVADIVNIQGDIYNKKLIDLYNELCNINNLAENRLGFDGLTETSNGKVKIELIKDEIKYGKSVIHIDKDTIILKDDRVEKNGSSELKYSINDTKELYKMLYNLNGQINNAKLSAFSSPVPSINVLEALHRYTEEGTYRTLNKKLKSGDKLTFEEYIVFVELRKYLRNCFVEYNTILYRGQRNGSKPEGFKSTSLKLTEASKFPNSKQIKASDKEILSILVPAGTNALLIDFNSRFNETEVLLGYEYDLIKLNNKVKYAYNASGLYGKTNIFDAKVVKNKRNIDIPDLVEQGIYYMYSEIRRSIINSIAVLEEIQEISFDDAFDIDDTPEYSMKYRLDDGRQISINLFKNDKNKDNVEINIKKANHPSSNIRKVIDISAYRVDELRNELDNILKYNTLNKSYTKLSFIGKRLMARLLELLKNNNLHITYRNFNERYFEHSNKKYYEINIGVLDAYNCNRDVMIKIREIRDGKFVCQVYVDKIEKKAMRFIDYDSVSNEIYNIIIDNIIIDLREILESVRYYINNYYKYIKMNRQLEPVRKIKTDPNSIVTAQYKLDEFIVEQYTSDLYFRNQRTKKTYKCNYNDNVVDIACNIFNELI